MDIIHTADQNILLWVVNARDDFLTEFFSVVTHGGDVVVIFVAVILICTVLLAVKRPNEAGLLVVALGASGLFTQMVKTLVSRERPDEMLRLVVETGASFPSAHTVGATVLYGMLAYFVLASAKSTLVKRATVSVLVLIILFVGFSRVYLGVHYPSDVLAGFIIGVFCVYTAALFHGRKRLPRV